LKDIGEKQLGNPGKVVFAMIRVGRRSIGNTTISKNLGSIDFIRVPRTLLVPIQSSIIGRSFQDGPDYTPGEESGVVAAMRILQIFNSSVSPDHVAIAHLKMIARMILQLLHNRFVLTGSTVCFKSKLPLTQLHSKWPQLHFKRYP
jgi:hypothetical protein